MVARLLELGWAGAVYLVYLHRLCTVVVFPGRTGTVYLEERKV